MQNISFLESPVGNLRILSNGSGITQITFVDYYCPEDPDIFTESAKTQLIEYFSGKRDVFQLQINPEGTEFEKKVWDEVLKIPKGQSLSYGELAGQLGDRKKAQAVGNANAKNPIAIVIPCHRVLGSDGTLTGYAGGIKRKEWLLKHEGTLLI